MIRWKVELPRQIAEEDKAECLVMADTIEEAIKKACATKGWQTTVGTRFCVYAYVEVAPKKELPLRPVD
jgi:hypothetical protein